MTAMNSMGENIRVLKRYLPNQPIVSFKRKNHKIFKCLNIHTQNIIRDRIIKLTKTLIEMKNRVRCANVLIPIYYTPPNVTNMT